MKGTTKRNIELMLLRWLGVFNKKALDKHYALMTKYRKEIIANRVHYVTENN